VGHAHCGSYHSLTKKGRKALYFCQRLLYNIKMDTENLVAHSRARFDHAVARRLLREKYTAKMVFAYRGGLFRAGPELLTLLQAIPMQDEVVVLDVYENPIKVDPLELQHLVFGRWQEQMTAWHVEFEQNNQQR
jgi:hypothetical protein